MTETIYQDKRHRKTIGLSTLTSIVSICLVILPAIGFMAKGTLVNVMSDAMADEITIKVKKEVAPINGGFRVLLENTIAELEDDISRLEYRQRNSSDFSELDQQDLTTKRRRLASTRDALRALNQGKSG